MAHLTGVLRCLLRTRPNALAGRRPMSARPSPRRSRPRPRPAASTTPLPHRPAAVKGPAEERSRAAAQLPVISRTAAGELDRECRPRAHRRAQRAGRPHAQLRHHRPGRHVRRPVTSAPHTRSRSSTVYASRAHAVVSSSARPRPHAAQASAQPISTSPVQSATCGEGLEVAIRRFLYLQ